jgi:hypothetical protein
MAPYLMIAGLLVCLVGWMGIPSQWVRDFEEALEKEGKHENNS